MKALAMKSIVALMLLALLPLASARAADARLVLPEFRALEEKASAIVNVNLDAPLLGLATRFLDDGNPDDSAIKELVAGLKGIYVRSYTFDSDFAYPKADIDRIRRQLSTPGWQKIVEVRSRKDQTDVDVYISTDGTKANGLAIIASEPREFTIVNIVGSIDLEKLHRLEGRFGVPELQLQSNAQSDK